MSIQSLILVPQPYFNEPGYEFKMGTALGEKESLTYSSELFLHTITYAMIEVIKSPPKGFESVVQTHFSLKKEEIIQQVAKWSTEISNKPEMLRVEMMLLKALEAV